MNKDQRLLEEAYKKVSKDSLTESEQEYVKKAASVIARAYDASRAKRKMIVLFKDCIVGSEIKHSLKSTNGVHNWFLENIINSLWNITVNQGRFHYRPYYKDKLISGSESNIEQFLQKAFEQVLIALISAVKRTGSTGYVSELVDYVRITREREKQVNKTLSKDFDIKAIEDF